MVSDDSDSDDDVLLSNLRQIRPREAARQITSAQAHPSIPPEGTADADEDEGYGEFVDDEYVYSWERQAYGGTCRPDPSGSESAPMPTRISEDWAQCDRCNKWRRIAVAVDVEKKWYVDYKILTDFNCAFVSLICKLQRIDAIVRRPQVLLDEHGGFVARQL